MKNSTLSRLCLFCFVIILFTSCEKNKPCLPPQAEINTNDNVFADGVLTLTAPAVSGATYSWTGPNNFSSNEQNPSISNVGINASGEYTLIVKVGECENSVSKDIEVMPSAPCSPANNTINFISTMSFSVIVCKINSSGRYEMRGSSSQGDVWIEFYGDPIAKGNFTYDLSTQNSSSYNAFMQIDISGVLSNWQALSGALYVTYANGKLSATFCNANFGNLQSTATKMASGRISCM